MNIKSLNLIPALLFICVGNAQADDKESAVESFLKAAEDAGVESYVVDESTKREVEQAIANKKVLSDEDKAVVNEIQAELESPEFKAKQKAWRERFGELMGSGAWQPEGAQDADTEKRIPYSERPLLFISSSMPMRTLRTYAHDMEKVRGAMILRGFVNGMNEIKPTLKFVNQILKVDESCATEPCARRQVEILIDPLIFREYAIQAVPAFTVHDVTDLDAYCKGTAGLNPASVVVYGDNSIEYLAERFAKDSGRSVDWLIEEVKSR